MARDWGRRINEDPRNKGDGHLQQQTFEIGEAEFSSIRVAIVDENGANGANADTLLLVVVSVAQVVWEGTMLAVIGVNSVVHHSVLVDLVVAHFHLDLKHLLHTAGEARCGVIRKFTSKVGMF